MCVCVCVCVCVCAGERLLEFCAVNNLTIMNTWFEKKEVHLATWKHPATKQSHMIDFVIKHIVRAKPSALSKNQSQLLACMRRCIRVRELAQMYPRTRARADVSAYASSRNISVANLTLAI